jgi:hypothetical protein
MISTVSVPLLGVSRFRVVDVMASNLNVHAKIWLPLGPSYTFTLITYVYFLKPIKASSKSRLISFSSLGHLTANAEFSSYWNARLVPLFYRSSQSKACQYV